MLMHESLKLQLNCCFIVDRAGEQTETINFAFRILMDKGIFPKLVSVHFSALLLIKQYNVLLVKIM